LGALVCKANKPDCHICPVSAACATGSGRRASARSVLRPALGALSE
jgi:adenine-specific DNA glycosylase